MEGVRLLDIAPTVLTMAGLPVPGSMQGRNILEHRWATVAAGH
jgi:arylsulfatase A-like enzyme